MGVAGGLEQGAEHLLVVALALQLALALGDVEHHRVHAHQPVVGAIHGEVARDPVPRAARRRWGVAGGLDLDQRPAAGDHAPVVRFELLADRPQQFGQAAAGVVARRAAVDVGQVVVDHHHPQLGVHEAQADGDRGIHRFQLRLGALQLLRALGHQRLEAAPVFLQLGVDPAQRVRHRLHLADAR